MKVYKHDRYKDAVLLALPAFTDKILGVPYFYSEITQNWERGNIGMSIPYYTQEKLDTMECLGETGKEWEFVQGEWFDASYLIEKRGKNEKRNKYK